MGERTWGKGSVQNVIEMENGRSALKLTTAAYFRPSGKNIHRFPDSKDTDVWGVMPDAGYDMRLSDHEEGLLLADRQQRDILRPHPASGGERATAPGSQPPKNDTTVLPLQPVPVGPQSAAAPRGPAPVKSATASQEAGPAARPRRSGAAAKSHAPFVDRQLQMAVEYLTDQLARAKK